MQLLSWLRAGDAWGPAASARPAASWWGAQPGLRLLSQQEVMEKYEVYRDSVDGLPSCQLEVQLYQKKIQDLAENRETLAGVLKEVGSVLAVESPTLVPGLALLFVTVS